MFSAANIATIDLGRLDRLSFDAYSSI